MKANLYNALNNIVMPTIGLYARWLFRLVVIFFSLSILTACGSESEQTQLLGINSYIAPEGHLTRTNLYIHWPAEYTKPLRNDPGVKELVPALTLKIPVEYLFQSTVSLDGAATIALHDAGWNQEQTPKTVNYRALINEAISIHDHQITRVYLALQPGAKPHVRELPFKDDPPDVERMKLERFINSYTVIIQGNHYFTTPFNERKSPEFSCTQDGENFCHLYFGIHGRMVEIGGIGEALDLPQLIAYNQKNKIAPAPSPSGLPKWRSKFDPTQALLNSFILPEDSPEVKKYFK
jgi:hypothetical protein